MKRHIFILSVLVLGILMGCSMMRKNVDNPIIGKWTAVHQSGTEIIFEFKPDMAMNCTIPDAPEYSFTANYTINTSKNPAMIDMSNIESMNIQGMCLAIVTFSGDDTMEFFGSFGEPGQVSRPSEFNKYADFPDLYLEFKKERD